jgi:hypothetical protein
MSLTLQKAFPAFKGGMLPIPRGRPNYDPQDHLPPTRKAAELRSMKYRQDPIYLSENSPRGVQVYRPDASLPVTVRSPRRSNSSLNAESLAPSLPAIGAPTMRSPTRSPTRSPVLSVLKSRTASPLSAHTPAASTWVSLPVEMGLSDKVTANVLKRVVAKFVLQRRPLPRRNELLEGPRLPDYELLRRIYKIPVRRVPYPHGNRSLEFEPTKMGADTRPATRTWKVLETSQSSMIRNDTDEAFSQPLDREIFEWEVETDEYTVLLVVGASFFSKNALCNPEILTNFLLDPVGMCKDEFLFEGTRVNEVSLFLSISMQTCGSLVFSFFEKFILNLLHVSDQETTRTTRTNSRPLTHGVTFQQDL